MTHGEQVCDSSVTQRIRSVRLYSSNSKIKLASIDGLVQKLKEEANCELVVIDHLHYFTEIQNVAHTAKNWAI